MQFGNGFFDGEQEVSNKITGKKVYKRASVQPCTMLEVQLLADVDRIIEANLDNPIVPIQALWLLVLTCSSNDRINSELFHKLAIEYLADGKTLETIAQKLPDE